MKTVSIRIPATLHKQLRKMAFERYMTIGEVVELVILNKLKK